MRPRRAAARVAAAALCCAALCALAAASDVPTTPVPLLMNKVVVSGACSRRLARTQRRCRARKAS